MAVSLLRRLAAGAPVPVFVAMGDAGRRAVRAVLRDPRLELASSPRHATVLLVAGAIGRADETALAHVHDQLPHPRAVVWAAWDTPPPAFVDPIVVLPDQPVGDALVAAHRDVITGERETSPRLLPASHPVAWQGTGDHGQGGEGMMGGTPYGRPMAMTGPDPRDGLQLDRMPLSIGPFLAAWWPPGLRLDLVLQGDVIALGEVAASRPFDEVLDGARTDDTRAVGAADPVLDVLLALGDRRLARRRAGDRTDVTPRELRRALAGLPVGAGRWEVDGRDVRDRVLAAIDGEARPDEPPVPHLPHLLVGCSWREAAVTIASLGIDLRPARVPTGGPA